MSFYFFIIELLNIMEYIKNCSIILNIFYILPIEKKKIEFFNRLIIKIFSFTFKIIVIKFHITIFIVNDVACFF